MNPEEIKALQSEMRRLNLYQGAVDGKLGPQTQAAMEIYRARQAEEAAAARAAGQKDKELEIKLLEAQGSKGTADAEAAALASETARKQRYDEQAASPLGLATKSAANLAAPAAGTTLGMALGKGVNAVMDESQRGKNATLKAVADDRMAGRTTVEGARTGAKLAGAMPYTNPIARTVSRMGPHAGLGLLSAGKGAQVLHDADPNGEYYPYQADRAAGLGYIGLGGGLVKQGIRQASGPKVVPDAQSLAIINSNQLRRNNATTAAPAAPKPDSRTALLADARAAGVKGVSRMNKGQLAQAILKAGSKAPAFAGPAAAAALAFGMTPDRAEAADGSAPGGQLTEALTNAAAAGGVAAGTQAGISKLGQMIGPMAGPAMGAAGGAMAPGMIDGMTDYSPDELAQGQNWMARNLPRALHFGAVDDAYQMAQTPEPSPLRKALMAGR